MSDDFLKVKKGLNTKPQSAAPTNQENGDIFYETGRGTHSVVASGQAMDLSSSVSVAGVASMTSAQMTAAALRSNVVTITGAVGVTLHGMTAMQNGRQITIINATSQPMLIPSESVTEGTPANRIHTVGAVTISVVSGGAITIVRDGPTGRWRVVVPSVASAGSDSGVFEWTVNGLVNGYSVNTILDGNRSAPSGFQIEVYGFSISTVNAALGATNIVATLQYRNGASWTSGLIPAATINSGAMHAYNSTVATLPLADSGGSQLRLNFNINGAGGWSTGNTNVSVQVFWRKV